YRYADRFESLLCAPRHISWHDALMPEKLPDSSE
ncbi:hypothetical protein A2U01_0118579, partial [Trifolium medium]|nr:hypothetical protein [Trifolium medium]